MAGGTIPSLAEAGEDEPIVAISAAVAASPKSFIIVLSRCSSDPGSHRDTRGRVAHVSRFSGSPTSEELAMVEGHASLEYSVRRPGVDGTLMPGATFGAGGYRPRLGWAVLGHHRQSVL